jgi:putative PIN family toxin of toxin-antitoxin system
MSSVRTVTIPVVELTLDQLVAAIRQLEPAARSEIAKALVETELDARLADLIKRLSIRPAADDITDADIADELTAVWRRPRLRDRISAADAEGLIEQLRLRGEMVEPVSVPPYCRDPGDQPVLAAAIDGRVAAIVTGDADLRADDELRRAMANYGVALWGVDSLLERLHAD